MASGAADLDQICMCADWAAAGSGCRYAAVKRCGSRGLLGDAKLQLDCSRYHL